MDKINLPHSCSIQWLKESNLAIGVSFSTVAKFSGQVDWLNDAWSVVVLIEKESAFSEFEGVISLLFPENCELELLIKGNGFELFEGNKKIANGVIKDLKI